MTLIDTIASILSVLWRIETSRSNQDNPLERRLRWAIEGAVVIVILAAGFSLGAHKYRGDIASARFYQSSFGPALNLTCNGKFNRIEANAATQDFLAYKSRSLGSCEGVQNLATKNILPVEASMRYLEFMAAIAWKIFGLSWESLFVVAGLLTAGLAVASYALLRAISESRLASALGTLAVMSSSPVINQIPHLRDFSKAPFLVAALACVAIAIVPPRRPISILLLMAVSGSIVSIGLGFRPDLNVILPIAVLAPLLLIGRAGWPDTVVAVAGAWAGFAVGYIALKLPLLIVGNVVGNEQADFIPHVFILGFSELFLEGQLGMAAADYSVFRPYYDEAVYGATNLFAGIPADHAIAWGSARYEEISARLLRAIFLLAPQDWLFRIFYTFNRIGQLPLLSQIWGSFLLLIAPLLLLSRLRSFLFIVLSFVILGSILSLQFHPRHAFYILVFGPALILLVLSAGLSFIRGPKQFWFKTRRHALQTTVGTILITLFVGGCAAALTEFLGALQHDALSRLTHAFSELRWQSISYRANQNVIEPELANKTDGSELVEFISKQHDRDPLPPLGPSAFSRLTLKLQPMDIMERIPFKLSWTASQEKLQIPNEDFQFTTRKRGYAIESGPISGTQLASHLASEDLPSKLLMRIKGETLSGAFDVRVLNAAKTKFAFSDRLPYGKWKYEKSFEITPDLDTFTILLDNPGGRSTLRVDSVELLVPPKSGCWSEGLTIRSRYLYVGEPADVGGFSLPAKWAS